MTRLPFKTVMTSALLFASWTAAQAPDSLSAQDREEIAALSAAYLGALRSCGAERYADLFVPATGYFASGFRGQMTGRDELIALVRSERHCLAPSENTSDREADGGYDSDVYEQLGPQRWRIASRTYVPPPAEATRPLPR